MRLTEVRLATLQGRAVLLGPDGCWDVETESGGAHSNDVILILGEWAAFLQWCRGHDFGSPTAFSMSDLGPCVPAPSQVFAIGLNYSGHAAESGVAPPKYPMVFTKFASCLSGPFDDIVLPSKAVDWEVELVVVIGATAAAVSESNAMDYVAGVCVGQDVSDRRVQWGGGEPAQFSLGKSYAGFGPIGPALVPIDEVDINDLELTCTVSGDVRQHSSTAHLIFPVPYLVSYLSGICTLRPGDLIFTGTPDGVGAAANPPRYLVAGDVVGSEISGLGQMENRCVTPAGSTQL